MATSGRSSDFDLSNGFGLEIMRERAEAVGGKLEVRSELGRGTQVIVRLPAILTQPPEKTAHGLRVLLVDDHPLYLEGLQALLSARGVQVVGAATDGVEAQQLARQFLPDLILMDVEMPRCNGLEATRQIKSELPDIKIVMLTVAADDETLFEALKNGAAGYLLKSLDGRQFFTLLTEVMRGETVLSPALAARVLSAFAQPQKAGSGVEALAGPPPNPKGGFRSGSSPSAPDAAFAQPQQDIPAEAEGPPVLTARQHEVLRLVAEGASNREIADTLHVTERTVKFHVGQILERLQLRNRYELAQFARQQQFVSPSKRSSSG